MNICKINLVFHEILKAVDDTEVVHFKNNYDKEKLADVLFDIFVYTCGTFMKMREPQIIPECIKDFQIKNRLADRIYYFETEVHFLLEEMYELLLGEKSEKAREIAKDKRIKNNINQVKYFNNIYNVTKEALKELGNFDCIIEEGCKEINSRSGSYDGEKFVKSETKYKADFSKCLK